jgi:hypothetical protein
MRITKELKTVALWRRGVSAILAVVIALGLLVHIEPQEALASGSHVPPNEWVVNPVFDYAQPLFDGLVLYRVDNGAPFGHAGSPIYCMVNATICPSTGGFFMEPKYDDIIISPTKTAFEQASRLFAAREAGEQFYRFYNRHGNVSLSGQYNEVTLFDSGIAWVQNHSGLWGAITTTGSTSAPFVYTEAIPVGGGSAIVKIQTNPPATDFYGIVDRRGNVIHQMELLNAERVPLDTQWQEKDGSGAWAAGTSSANPNKGWAFVPEFGNRIFYVEDTQGNRLYGMYRVGSSINGTQMTSAPNEGNMPGRLLEHPIPGLHSYGETDPGTLPSDTVRADITTTGMYSSIEILHGTYSPNFIPPAFSTIPTYDFFAPLWRVERNGLYGVLGVDGDLLAPAVYSSVDLIYPSGANGNMPFAIINSNGKVGLVSPKGLVFDSIYDNIQVTMAGINTAYYLIETTDVSTGVTIPYLLDENFEFIRINPFTTFERDPTTGYRVECRLDTTTGRFLFGMTDRFGVEIVPFVYDMLDFFRDGYARYAIMQPNGEFNFGLIGICGWIALGNNPNGTAATDRNGQPKPIINLSNILPFADGRWVINHHVVAQNAVDGKWGMIEAEANHELSLVSGRRYPLPQRTTRGHDVIWQSMNTDIVTIERGRLIPNAPGRTSIILFNSTTDTNTTWMVDVKVPARSINVLSRTPAILKVDHRGIPLMENSYIPSVHLVSRVPPHPVNEESLLYMLTFPKNQEPSAFLDNDNTVWAIRHGRARLTITEPVGGRRRNINIRVFEMPNDVKITHKAATPATPPSVATSKVNVDIGRSISLRADIPNRRFIHRDDRLILWRTSDVNVARVDHRGRVTRTGPGRCYIIAYTSNGLFDIIEIDDGKGGPIAPPMMTVEALLSPPLNVIDPVLLNLINLIDPHNPLYQNLIHLEINNSVTHLIPFDKHISLWRCPDTGVDIDHFIKNDMYGSGIPSLTMGNAVRFAKAIEWALNEAIKEYNGAENASISPINIHITPDMRFAAAMQSGSQFIFPTCSPVPGTGWVHGGMRSVGCLFLHQFCEFDSTGSRGEVLFPIFE